MAFVKTRQVEDPAENALQPILAAPGADDFVICKGPEKLKSLLLSLRQGHSTHFVSDGDFSMHDIVIELLKKYKPAELWITTYALREFSIRQLLAALDRKDLLSVAMLIDYRAKMRTPEVFQLASMNVNRIHLTSIHAKVCVIRSSFGSVSIVGSANWTTNPRIEAGVITLCPDVASFHIDWIEKVMSNAELFS